MPTPEQSAAPTEEFPNTTAVPIEKKEPVASGEEEEEEAEKPMVPVGELFRYADGTDKVLISLGMFGAFISGAGLPAFSEIFGQMINELLTNPSDVEQKMSDLALIMVYCGLVVGVASVAQVGCMMVSAARQMRKIRHAFFIAAMRQDVAWHDEHKPGALTARLVGDTNVIEQGINDKISNGFANCSMVLTGFGLGFYRSWELTLVMLGTMPLIAGIGAVMASVVTDATNATRKGYALAGEIATEVLDNVRTVQVFGTEEREVERFTHNLGPAKAAGMKKELTFNLSVGATYGVSFASYGIAFWFSAFLIEEERNTVGEIFSCFFAVMMGTFGIGMIFPSVSAFMEARTAAFVIFETINRVPAIDIDEDPSTKTPLPAGGLQEGIEFRNVKFTYPTRPDMKLFSDLNVTIPKGTKVAFSGASGCGKSSIVSLLQRFYDPVQGQVLVDGVDMRDLSVVEWRSHIGIVSQEPTLFSGSVAENVRVGHPDATMEEVVRACKRANIHDTIMTLPHQYDTPVGTVGSQLSGGQKQRIAIARAIVKNPKLLILDEATSALDRQSEMEVQRALDELVMAPVTASGSPTNVTSPSSAAGDSEKLTVVVIAHRLATIRNVDCIHYISYDEMKGSALCESGTFDELMELGGHFANMAAIQQKENGTPTPMASPGGVAGVTPKANEPSAAAADAAEEDDVVGNSSMTILSAEDKKKKEAQERLKKEAEAEEEKADIAVVRVAKMMNKKWAVVCGMFGSLLTGAMYPLFAVVITFMMETLGTNGDDPDKLRDETKLWAPMYVLVGFVGFAGWALQACYAIAGEDLTERLRASLFRAILRQDATFFDTPGRDPGALGGVISGDTEAVHLLFGPAMGFKLQMACNILAGIVIAFIYSWRIALVTIACLPFMVMGGAVQQVLIAGQSFGDNGGGENDNSIVAETLNNIRAVCSFNYQPKRAAVYEAKANEQTPAALRTAILAGLAFGFGQFTVYGTFALTFWYGGKLMSDGTHNFREVMIASMGVLMGAMGAGETGGFAAKAENADQSAKRVFAIIDRTPTIDVYASGDCNLDNDDEDTEGKYPKGGCHIELEGLEFVYPARPLAKVLDGVNGTMYDKQFIGLMGSTGCGKSTIMQQLCRFYDPDNGRILINGKDMRKLDMKTWRENISIVSQEPSLFSGTVKENIRYARPEATDEEIVEMAKLCAVHDDIMKMPEGYDTDVGYKGRQLSGGQKQRVAMARGLLRRPRLLLLDEATSALDNATEAKVQDGLYQVVKQHPMTVVSIAHRLTTIDKSDNIFLLDQGKVMEEGNHEQLMSIEDGEYRKRYELFQASAAGGAAASPSASPQQ